jgi:hypothetical protein
VWNQLRAGASYDFPQGFSCLWPDSSQELELGGPGWCVRAPCEWSGVEGGDPGEAGKGGIFSDVPGWTD